MKLITSVIAALAITALTAPVFADPGNSQGQGNNEAAQNMAGGLQGNRGEASVAASVSGAAKGAEKGDSGWGNVGSRAVAGDQVSKSGKP